jgi:hypothetical protein
VAALATEPCLEPYNAHGKRALGQADLRPIVNMRAMIRTFELIMESLRAHA